MDDVRCCITYEEGPHGIPLMVVSATRDIAGWRAPGSAAGRVNGSIYERVNDRVYDGAAGDNRMLLVGRFPIAELCARAGAPFAEAVRTAHVDPADFSAPARRYVLCSGWQSWSFAGELCGKERPRRAILKKSLNIFIDHPAEAEISAMARRGAVPGRRDRAMVSHFFTVLRVGSARLALVSVGGNALPPVTFLIDADSVSIAVLADGAAFGAGDPLARIALASGSDYFGLKDRFAALFGRFDPPGGVKETELDAAVTSGADARAVNPAAEPASPDRFSAVRFLGEKTPIGGFETWYNHYLTIDEKMMADDIAALGSTPNLINSFFVKRGKPAVFQIDDGWERMVGDWRPHEQKFPHGMAALAADIEAKGYIPGLWVAPFATLPGAPVVAEHPDWLLRDKTGAPVSAGWNPGWGGNFFCLDLSQPEVLDYLSELFETIVDEWGYRYLKLDFLYAGMLPGGRGEGWKHYDAALRRITSIKSNRAGLPVAFLACGSPIESTAPHMPLMRVGADTRERWEYPVARLIGHQGRPSAKVNMGHTLARALLDRTVLLSDPDVVFCRMERTSLKASEKFLIGLVAKMFASQIMSSDEPGNMTGEEEAFTRELIGLYDRLEGREFGVERFSSRSPDVYRIFSRDGDIDGIINLSGRAQLLTLPSIVAPASARTSEDTRASEPAGTPAGIDADGTTSAAADMPAGADGGGDGDAGGKQALVPAHAVLFFGLP